MGPVEVSVIIPTLNEGDYLPALLRSLDRQSFKAFEVVVVDGGSQDRTITEALEFKARTIVRRSNIAEARNIGVAFSSAPFLVFLDADTVVPPDFLRKVVQAMRRGAGFIVARPEPLERSLAGRLGYAFGWGLCRLGLTNPCYMGVGVSREVFAQVGGFDESLVYNEDLDFLRKALTVKRSVFPRDLVSYNSTRRWIRRGRGGILEPFRILGRILEYFLFRKSKAYYPTYHAKSAEP
ncbi:MAG: glycosyltransferase [Candidatus Bathyarchaeia archaeon]